MKLRELDRLKASFLPHCQRMKESRSMCFSASASFIAGTSLAAIGVAMGVYLQPQIQSDRRVSGRTDAMIFDREESGDACGTVT